MLLKADNLSQLKFKTKRIKLEKAENTEINIALLPSSLILEGRNLKEIQDVKEKSEKMDEYGLKILMAAVVDENGEPVFTTAESFESLPLAIQNEITEAVWEYNGLSGKGVENLEKN